MKYRPLGTTGLKVSEIGFGCSRLGGTAEMGENREALATLAEALERGVSFFDVADSYGQGRAEVLLGKAVGRRRGSVVIASKAGYPFPAVEGWWAKLKPLVRPLLKGPEPAPPIQQNFSPQYLTKAVDASLRRLATDYLDLFLLHNPPPAAAETDGLGEALEQMKREGKIRHYGVSCASVAEASRWLWFGGVEVIQLRLNLLEFEEALPVVRQAGRKGIGVIAREALGSGRVWESAEFGFLVREGRRTWAQAALQFPLAFPEVAVAIAGMGSREHLLENLGTLEAPRLTEEEFGRIAKSSHVHAY